MAALHDLTIAEAADLIRRRELSPVALTQACLERVAQVDGRLNAFITVLGDQALRQAQEAEAEIAAGRQRGPLHGIPIGLKVGSFRPGMTALETLMPMLYSEGVRKGRISLSRFVEVTSTNAAKLFGMYPQKGTIAIGSDADLGVWDPQRRRTVRASETHTRSDFDVFEGWEVQGWPIYTISRGEVIVDNGKVTGARGRGRPVKRGRHMPL